MPERAANLRADLILKAMIAVTSADAGGIEDSEISLMQQVYQDQAKRPITPQEIAEVAVACAYAILDAEDPIGAAARLAAGFHAQYPLREEELDLLFDLIAMRLVTSVTISAARKDRTADNPYLSISEAPAWRLLHRLGRMNRRFATAILRHACGFEAVHGARAVTGWIAANRAQLAPMLDRHSATLAKALVPYGDPQNPMTVTSAAQQPDKATAWWDAYCAEHGIELGIGPWGEARTV